MVTIHRVRNAFNAVTAKKSMDTQTISERNNDFRNNRNGCFARAISGSQQRQKLYVLILLMLFAVIFFIFLLITRSIRLEKVRQYRYRGNAEPELHDNNIVQRVDMREAQFLRRSQFDEIQYGAALKRNAKGAILRPVITAHGHFQSTEYFIPTVKHM